MRRHVGWLAALALAGAGCHKGADHEPRTDEQAQADEAPSAHSGEAPAEAPEKPIAITSGLIDKYLAYQDAVLEANQDTLRQLQKMGGKADAGAYDGTLGGFAGMRDGMNVLARQQKAEERARNQVGLSEREIDQVRGVVGEVITRRQLATTLHLDVQIQQFEKMRDQMPADQRKDMDQTIQRLKEQQEETVKLSEARARYGDANVDAVLAREKDLTAAYERWLKVFAGAK